MISIRKRENETIIIQNFKDSYFIFSFVIGSYCILNFLGIFLWGVKVRIRWQTTKYLALNYSKKCSFTAICNEIFPYFVEKELFSLTLCFVSI